MDNKTNVVGDSVQNTQAQPSQPTPPVQQTSYNTNQTPPNKKGIKTWHIVLLGVLAAIIAFFVFAFTFPTSKLYEAVIKDQVKYQIVAADYMLYAMNGHTDEESKAILTDLSEARELLENKYKEKEGNVTYRQIFKYFLNEDDENIAYYSTILYDLLNRYDALEIELSEFKEIENNSDYELYSFKELKTDLDFKLEYNYSEGGVECSMDDNSFEEYFDKKFNPG